MATTAQRKHLVSLMNLTLLSEPRMHYKQLRPMASKNMTEIAFKKALRSEKGIYLDCSESITLFCRFAGLKDPNGLAYSGWGNSHTMWKHLPHYTNPSHALPGAIVAYGIQGYDHVAMVLERGPDPWLWSHGQERGPLKIRWSDENRYHGGTGVLLNVSGL